MGSTTMERNNNFQTVIPCISMTATLGDETAAGEINQGWGRYGWEKETGVILVIHLKSQVLL